MVLSLVGVGLLSVMGANLGFSRGLAQTQSNADEAQRMAYSVVQLAIAEIQRDENFSGSLRYDSTSGEGYGEVTFDSTREYWSLNNVGSDAGQFGFREMAVPSNSILVVGTGVYRNSRKTYAVLLTVPPFPYSLASSGPITTSGRNIIGGVESVEDLRDGLQPEDITEGAIATNARAEDFGNQETLRLDGEVTIVGDAKSAGGFIELGEVTIERGEFLTGESELPQIEIRNYDPTGREGLVSHQAVEYSAAQTLYGLNLWDGPSDGVHFQDGLELDGGLLYVKGDVRIDGPITGKGALVATGNVEIVGGASFDADVNVAVLAEGDLTVQGTGREASQFTGLLYCEGEMEVQRITTVGTFLANGPESELRVEDAVILHNPEVAKLNITQLEGEPNPFANSLLQAQLAELNAAGVHLEEVTVASFTGANGELLWRPIRIEYAGMTYTNPNDVPLNDPVLSSHLASLHTSVSTVWQEFLADADAGVASVERQTMFVLELNEFLSLTERLSLGPWTKIDG